MLRLPLTTSISTLNRNLLSKTLSFNSTNKVLPSLTRFYGITKVNSSLNIQKNLSNSQSLILLSKRWNSTNKEVNNNSNKEKLIEKLAPLKENLYTIPNALTFARLLSTPILGYWIINNQLTNALALFIVSGITDLLDGYIARKYNMQSYVGSIIDPMADKALMTVMTLSLTYIDLIPLPLAVVIIGRDLGLVISSFYYRWISLPPPKTFTRYWDFSLPSVEVKPTQISKINTFLQLGYVGTTLISSWWGITSHPLLTSFQFLVGGTTIASGLSYVFSKDAVKILKQANTSSKLK
ncbi:hypothetical protein CONCODRAFT_77638 [Conidiobolus coronatus NRRL 28638]|uniref:CDP-alcohol phosphatidyltransferase n=1 Tax=Conidiobolus coronatus (strain ATCC 28846 / CBS 209.66 / NRRL 28638) TaxID=796925 RepID=A0A137PCR6_CONC2|nr:hypothetical protein CONCODRAFT_77638 [Conidiobolus coronatus NRRL 28638]|eukprot:KXN72794.1 hypothetical protein CONCODRAFT_77638 [Conidiobolus coronatus NRRL 28638]